MLVDLVRVQSGDGFTLDGALQRASAEGPVDAVILVHGTGSNFYQSTFLEFLSDRFLSMGVSTLRVNTRGHDGISIASTTRGGVRLGAAFESVDDCRHDLTAWMKFAQENIGPRIVLLGHSLGAVKCVYATVHERLEPTAVIALSPPRLSYEWFCGSSKRDEFLATFRRAEELVNAGKAATLIEATMPLPMIISAGGYVDKYGPDERIAIVPLAKRLKPASLFVFGAKEVESNVAFQALPGEIVGSRVIAGADHFYTGVREAVWSAIEGWFEVVE